MIVIVLYEPCVCLHSGSNPLENSLFVVMGKLLVQASRDGQQSRPVWVDRLDTQKDLQPSSDTQSNP
jgi:hypothetical protein